MKVSTIYVNTHRYDVSFTRTCIASIRYWYPDVHVSLIVDHTNGNFPDTDLLRKFRVELFPNSNARYGWGFGKFEPLFMTQRHSFLILDADTALTGDILNKVSEIDDPFIVDLEDTTPENVNNLYYDVDQVGRKFNDFLYPGYMFNTGQWFGTSGLIRREDLNGLIYFDTVTGPKLMNPDIFRQADQGVFNFILHKLVAQGRITVSRIPLMIWPEAGSGDFISIDSIKNRKSEFPFIIHWAGMKYGRRSAFPRGDILQFYYDFWKKMTPAGNRVFSSCLDQFLKFEKKYKLLTA